MMALPPDARGRYLIGVVARNAYERGVAAEATAILEDAFRELATTLLTRYGTLTDTDRARKAALFQRTAELLGRAYGEVYARTTRELTAYQGVEIEAAGAELRALLGAVDPTQAATLGALTPQRLTSIAEFPIQGDTLGQWWQGQANGMASATRRTIQLGLAQGEGTRDIARRLVPARSTDLADDFSVWRRARREATMIVRTAANAVATDAAYWTYAGAGDRVSTEYEILTARDARVSKICASKDGRRYRYDDPKREMPPFHLNCRTTIIPALNFRALGLTEPARSSPLTIRSFDAWLRDQPQATAVAILGRQRAEWYAAGRLSLPQLVDTDNRVLTLDQLRDRIAPDPARPPGARVPRNRVG